MTQELFTKVFEGSVNTLRQDLHHAGPRPIDRWRLISVAPVGSQFLAVYEKIEPVPVTNLQAKMVLEALDAADGLVHLHGNTAACQAYRVAAAQARGVLAGLPPTSKLFAEKEVAEMMTEDREKVIRHLMDGLKEAVQEIKDWKTYDAVRDGEK